MAECPDHTVSTKTHEEKEEEWIFCITPKPDPTASAQGSNNLKVTTQGGDGQICDESDQSKCNNVKNSIVGDSQAESRKIYSRNAEIEPGDYDQLGRQQSQKSNGPAELEQGKHDSVETGQAAGRGISGQIMPRSNQGEAATRQRKDTRTVTEPRNTSTSKPQKSPLCVASICEPPNVQTPTESTTVYFYLLITGLGNDLVEEAEIHFGSEEIKPLYQDQQETNLWYCSVTFHRDPIKYHMKYKYGLHISGDKRNISNLGKVEELSKRDMKDMKCRVQCNVFRFPDNRYHQNETIPTSVIWYLKWFLQFVEGSTISDILSHIRCQFNFKSLSKEHVKELVRWILAQASGNSSAMIPPLQRLYLCVMLSHLSENCNLLPYLNGNKTACDRLLQCFTTCVHSNYLSKSDLKRLKKIAIILVENSNYPGWLTFAAHFYPYFGIEFLLHNKDAKLFDYRYGNEEYQKMITVLFSCLKVENQDNSQDLLLLVLKSAPNMLATLDVFKRSETREFFAIDENKMLDFFVKFFQNTQNTNEKKQSLPEDIRSKINLLLYSTLLKYAKSSDELKDEDIQHLLNLILSKKDLCMDQFTKTLLKLSASKSVPRQELLLEILNDELFKKDWLEIPFEKKVDICKLWVTTRVANISGANSLDSSNAVVAVYESIVAIMRCSLNVSMDKALAQEMFISVVQTIFENKDIIVVLQALSSIEKCSPEVQECYISHVRTILTPELINKSSQYLKEYSSSSLRRELLLCILEIVDIPEVVKDRELDEDDFSKILYWCDVWIILLNTNEMLENSKKYEDGKNICQQLKERIEVGNISLDFLIVLENDKKKVSKLCELLTKQQPRQTFEDQISKLKKVVEDCSKKFQLLESAINFVKRLSNVFYGIETIIKSFKDLNKNWRSKKIYELQLDTFWAELFPFLSPAEALRPLVDSLSFVTVVENALKELSKSSADEHEYEETAVRDFRSLIVFITTKAIEEFQVHWYPLVDDPGLLSVESMKTLIGPLRDQNRLDEELELLEKYFSRKFTHNVKIYIQDYYVKYPNVVEQVQRVIGILKIFGLVDPLNGTMLKLLKFQTILENSGELTLASFHESMKDVKQIVEPFSGEELDCVIQELSRSSPLLSFIEEIVDDDIHLLIDAVEEHSDQFVSESLVSDLIDVHGFLAPLIKKKNEEKLNAQKFLEMFKKSWISHRDIPVKIQECNTNVYSLRGLYISIADRGEITKEIIGNCLNKGEYRVSQKEGNYETKMSYVIHGRGEDKTCNYSLSDLHDLRSRAHLIVSSHKNAVKIPPSHSNESTDFNNFINQVNLLTEISTLLSKLRSSGYMKYRQFEKRMQNTKDLQRNKDSLREDLENWEKELKNARENFYFLNYYSSDQICTLYDFLMNGSKVNSDEVLSLIHFVDRTITKQDLENQQSHKGLQKSDLIDNPNSLLSTTGKALENIFSKPHRNIRLIPDDGQSQSYSKLETTVKPGEIFVASLEPESPLTANVILTLYENTSNAFPEPYQIVFCSAQTTWEEMHLLLQRCFTNSKYLYHKSLFCIVNVELLPNELQFKLVNAIKEKQKCCQSAKTIKENANYQLALICRGGDHHHIVEQFALHSHHTTGMTDHALAHRLKSGWPDVKIITSTLPGLGKTEQIKQEVIRKRMNNATFSISGPLEPSKLIQRLKELKLKKYHCLHLDIGEVSNSLLLDAFLFQLIVTGMVSAGNQFYHLPTLHIYIEIANTLKEWLRESLVVSKYFTRINLKWQNYKDLLVSPEITSNVQVVCQYLDIFDRACIESKEVHFSGPKTSTPLSEDRCQNLLNRYFSSNADITFTVLNTFLAVLADQLLKFSKSPFLKIENIISMAGDKAASVRTTLFCALMDVSKQFASRAITTCRSSIIQNLSQKESARALDKATMSTTKSATDMVERVKGMVQWKDSNHLLVVFHGLNSQAITALYRTKTLVPLNVETLLKSQDVKGSKELEDFNNFTQEQLREKLEKITCIKPVEKKLCIDPSYALTQDNILKIILIILRVRVNVPVIIMGETGCGKTSLVRYLANTCGVQFYTFNLHAGISEEKIISFITEKERHARKIKEQIWIFLDEINTCDHLGLISDIMCHHSLFGRLLSKNLVFLAACNPYKIRPEEHIRTAGLKGRNTTDEYSKLVYRVHPLPEAMIDYVWDYGSLTPDDERDYIKRMVRDLPEKYQGMLADLLAASQRFIRYAEKNPFCVSLRDVNRCIILINWFEKMKEKRQKINTSIKKDRCPEHLREYHSMSERYNEMPMIKSIVLAVAHCYLSRLPTAKLRGDYRKRIIDIFCRNGYTMIHRLNSDTFAAIVRMEEEDYLDRMELPRGTARNVALRENVFVMLVCILNCIPVFVVGNPGCSKSLSIQLIRSNLRGRDSRDPLFRELPQLYVVSYQGSESSTSEGIIKVFEKVRKYKCHNKTGNILPVVLLDEVGLAENSKYNPLKVLHSLLETGEGKVPDVAVVGISNWSLDAAKMNRAIHLSRPKPTTEDLYETGQSLHCVDSGGYGQNIEKKEPQLECLAEAYFEYEGQQSHNNFHGLRDYYSLIKSLPVCCNFQQVNISLQRNFGGLPGEVTNIQKIFLDKLREHMTPSSQDIIPVTRLIHANLADPQARHLMLIGHGDSAIGILKESLAEVKKETVTIYGSRFEEDLSEEYNYRILSRIILCMERDCILILRDLESIYGSLYDMLNQNYAVVGNKKHCRVALGAHSKPMCQVNDGFRCIVLIDQHKVDFSDPPFLNRFEKQVLRFYDVLTKDQHNCIAKLHHWVQGMSTVEGLESHFRETDMFIGFNEDTLPSLVLSHGHDTESPPKEILKKCKDDMMWIASPDGVLRTQRCNLLKKDSQEVQELSDEYFKKPLHQGFAAFMEYIVVKHQKPSFFASDEIGSKTVVMTFSNIHTDIRQCLGNDIRSQVERLTAYKSEKQLGERIDKFWNAPEKELLVLQCKPHLDGTHLLLARSIIEEKRNSYKQCLSEMDSQGYKHVCIVVHVKRREAEDSVPWQFSFLCGWRQVFLDMLEAPPVPLNEIRGKSIHDCLTNNKMSTIQKIECSTPEQPIHRIAQSHLLWCFTCIKYTRSQRPLDTTLKIAKNLFNSNAVSHIIEKLILETIDKNDHEQDQEPYTKDNWQVTVACDLQSLLNSSTLYSAMEQFVSRLVRNPLAKIVYFLEKENAWPPHVIVDPNATPISKLEDLWCNAIMNNAIFKMSDIPEPLGVESYVLDSYSVDLSLPFSQVVSRKVDGVIQNEDNLGKNGQLKETVRHELEKLAIMVPELRCYTSEFYDLYVKDIFDIMTNDFSPMLSRSQRVSIAEATFVSEVKQTLPAKDMPEFLTLLHTFVWVHREQILALLRMVDCCKRIGLNLLTSVTNVMFCSPKVIFVKSNEINLSQEESSKQEYSGNISKVSNNESRKTGDPNKNIMLNPESGTKKNEAVQSATKPAEVGLEKASPASSDLQNNGEAVEEEMEHYEDSERFEDKLITAYCEEMLPSGEVVKKNGGIKQWVRNANLLLSLALKISQYPTALHYLRLCVDFARIICTPTAVPTSLPWLDILNKIGIHLRPEYLDHNDSFETITNQLIKPMQKEMKDRINKQEALQKFSALFYGRCIDTNVDTSGARQMVEQILLLDRPELVMMMSPVVLRLLMVDAVESPGIFTHLITNPSVIKNCPCLQNIDEVFKDRFLKGLIHHDSYPAVMICDLIQCLLHFEDNFKINDINSSDCTVLMLARSATALISKNSENRCGLSVLSAVAFLRSFFTMLARFVVKNPSVLNKNALLMTEVNSLLKNHKTALEVFFVKQLRQHKSLFDLQTWFGENNVLSTIKELWLKETNQGKAVFTSVFKYSEYEEAKAAYWKLESDELSTMQIFLTNCGTSPNHAFSLLGILINMVYLKRAERKLTNKEETLVDWFEGKVTFFPILFKKLLLKVVGRCDFNCPQLQLSPESSVEEVEIALLVIHIACVVATSALSEDLPMYRYFTNPVKFESPCVLAHSKEDVCSIFEYQSTVKESVCVSCACGSRLAFKSNVNEKKCPHCQDVLRDKTRSRSTSPETATTLLIPCDGDTSPEWDRCTQNMSPPVYRALHLIVYSSYYAGIALGTSSEPSVLNMLHGLDLGTDSTSAASFCFKNIETDLLYLMKILRCKKDVAINTMHLVVEKCSDLIRSKRLLGANDCSTADMRREWEAVFSQLTQTVFLNARETLEETKEIIQRQQTDDSQDKITLECRILELDNYPKRPKEQNEQLKRLFRVTKHPSFEDFRSAFLYSPKAVQAEHRCLTLFISEFDQLRITGNLHHLLKWSRLVSSTLTHRVSRKDVESKSINDFITGHLLEINRSPQETESLKVLFNNFKEAWHKVCDLVNQKLVDKEEMPRLTEADHVAYCLIESDYGIYLRMAIEILVSHQNSILDAIISLSSAYHSPALSFLEKDNGSGVMSASIQEVKEKEIISFKWSDDLFKYAKNNPEYGKGQEITYDFEQIEMELATNIAFGKCYLTGTLDKFIFAKELFHSCSSLLTEIRSLVKQSPSLPEDVRKGLSDLKERRIKEAQDLLQHIEVLIYLLTRKLKDFSVDMTLEKLAEKWSQMLPSSFPINLLPEPRSSIKIEHVAALYEALEDVLADGAINGLAGKFRDELPEELKKVLTFPDKEINELKPHNFLKALRRFVFRYLSSEAKRYWLDESTELQSCLKEDSLWFPLEPRNLEGIPNEFTLKHIHSTVKYLEELLEKEKKDNTSTRSSSGYVTKRYRRGRQLHGVF